MALGPLMVDLDGPVLEPAEAELLAHPMVGGVILFARNFVDVAQLSQLTSQIHEIRQPRLLIAVDQEGGRVQRFREGFTQLPPARRFGAQYDEDPELARISAETSGWLIGSELRSVGVDFSFAPVLDLDTGHSKVIGDRAYHSAPETVAELARCVMRGLRDAGAAAVGKHFPGHGTAIEDSHLQVVQDHRSMAEFRLNDLIPFERLIHFGLPAVMLSHVVAPQVDSHPAGLSPYWHSEVLRGELGFSGAAFSDDVNMAGAGSGRTPERALRALRAGCDMVLACNDRPGVEAVLEQHGDWKTDPVVSARLMRLHGRGQLDRLQLLGSARYRSAVEQMAVLEPELALDLGDDVPA